MWSVCESTFRRNVPYPPSGSKISRAGNQRVAGGSDTFLRNVGSHTDYKELYFRGCNIQEHQRLGNKASICKHKLLVSCIKTSKFMLNQNYPEARRNF
jgi:hypothetical protein